MKNINIVIVFGLMLLANNSFGQGKDHPILSRYSGASIKFHYQKAYNELDFPTAVVDSEPGKLLKVKGKHTSILYAGPEGRSTLEIFRNYQKAIRDAGGEILFSCEGKYAPGGCDDYRKYYGLKFFSSNYGKRRTGTDQYSYVEGGSDDQAFLVAKFESSTTLTHVEIGITGKFLGHPSSIQVEVVEEQKMEDGLITAEKLENEMRRKGKVALYGIYFDTGSATIKPASYAELKIVADYLKKNDQLKIYVVGHTDDVGGLSSNVTLSKKRGQAVKAYLEGQGISASRLLADGAGPLAPVATNETEDGRKQNRRVELVRRMN